MKIAFFLFISFISTLSLADCTKAELCSKNLSLEVMELTENILPITKEVFRDNWYLILEKENLMKKQEFLNSEKSCKNVNDLIYAPEGSPLADFPYKSDEPKYFFMSRVMKQILESKKMGGGLQFGISDAFKKHMEWQKSQPKDEFAKKKEEYKQEFLKNCHEDKSEQILTTYNEIMSEHGELEELQSIFQEMKNECQNIFPVYGTDYDTGARYSKNDYASKFDTLKNFAELGCYPMDLVDRYFRDEETECGKYLEDIYEIVNPECANKLGTDLGFLCNGLHDYLAKQFIQNPIYDEYLERFLDLLEKNKKNGKPFDLDKLAMKATNNDPVAAWRLIALLGHDEINTTMKMIREELIRSGQNERFIKTRHLYTGESDNKGEQSFVFKGEVITQAPKHQNMKLFADLIKTNGRFAGEKVDGRYYHYIAGGMVACELKARGHSNFRANLAATGTGVAYEAYDFESHTHFVENSQIAHMGKKDRLSETQLSDKMYEGNKKSFAQYSKMYEDSLKSFNQGNLKINYEEAYAAYSQEYDKREERKSYWYRLKNTPWKDSFQNFYDDSSLHKRGGELGAKMCRKTTSKR